MNTKKYRVSANDHFNLMSMYDKLQCWKIDCEEGKRNDYDEVLEKIEELDKLLSKAHCVGALVDAETYAKIREVSITREIMRDQVVYEAKQPNKHR